MVRRTQRDLCNEPVFSGMFFYALPLIATGILQVLYNSAATMVVGQFAGDESLAAVASTNAFINLLVNLFMGLSTGILTVVARHIGAKHTKELQRSIHTAMPLAVICGVLLMAIGLLVAEPVLRLMGTGEEGSTVFAKAVLYTRIYFLGTPAFLVYNFGAAVLRAAGDTKRPLIYLTVSGILNVILNLVLVIVAHMDVAGVAVATVVSQYVSAVLVVLCLMRETGDIRFCPSRMCLDRRQLFEILRIGIPTGLQSSMFSVSNAIMQSTVNTFGDMFVAGAGAAGQLENFLYTAINAYSTTTTAFTSQNFGAHKKSRIRSTLRYGHLLSLATCLSISALILVFHMPLLRIFTSSPEAIAAGSIHLTVIVSTVFLDGALQVQVGYLRGFGFSLVPTLTLLVGTCGLRVVWILLIFPYIGGTWDMLFFSYPITWSVTLIASVLYSHHAVRRMLRSFQNNETNEPASRPMAT